MKKNEIYIDEVVKLYFDGHTVDEAVKIVKEMIKQRKAMEGLNDNTGEAEVNFGISK